MGRSVARSNPTSKDRRTAVSPFRSLPELHPHEARAVRLKEACTGGTSSGSQGLASHI